MHRWGADVATLRGCHAEDWHWVARGGGHGAERSGRNVGLGTWGMGRAGRPRALEEDGIGKVDPLHLGPPDGGRTAVQPVSCRALLSQLRLSSHRGCRCSELFRIECRK